MKVKDVQVKFKAGPEDGLGEGEFLVYPSTFTRVPDSYGDVVAKGAFAQTIAEWEASGNVLPGLYGHRMDDPDFFIASALEMSEDDHGWLVKGAFDLDTQKGAQVYRLVKSRRLNQLSFAFDVREEGVTTLDDDTTANELRNLKVYEFSFVPVGANQDTEVIAVKSAAEVLLAGVKSGRTVNQKHIDSLRAAQEAITDAIASVTGSGTGEAAGTTEAKSAAGDEEPPVAKSPAADEEPKSSPSADSVLAQINLTELERNWS